MWDARRLTVGARKLLGKTMSGFQGVTKCVVKTAVCGGAHLLDMRYAAVEKGGERLGWAWVGKILSELGF